MSVYIPLAGPIISKDPKQTLEITGVSLENRLRHRGNREPWKEGTAHAKPPGSLVEITTNQNRLSGSQIMAGLEQAPHTFSHEVEPTDSAQRSGSQLECDQAPEGLSVQSTAPEPLPPRPWEPV